LKRRKKREEEEAEVKCKNMQKQKHLKSLNCAQAIEKDGKAEALANQTQNKHKTISNQTNQIPIICSSKNNQTNQMFIKK